jgi:hypothetical protein
VLAIVIGMPLVAVGAALIPALVGTVVGKAVSSRVPADAKGASGDGAAGGFARKLLLGCVALIVIVAVVQIATAIQEARVSEAGEGVSLASNGSLKNAAPGDPVATTESSAGGATAAGAGVAAGTGNADPDYILPSSASAYLSEADLADLDADHAVLALNEIYARHGREFTTPSIAAYFGSKDWYEPVYAPDEFPDAALSDVERANVDAIVAYLDERGWRQHVPFS